MEVGWAGSRLNSPRSQMEEREAEVLFRKDGLGPWSSGLALPQAAWCLGGLWTC